MLMLTPPIWVALGILLSTDQYQEKKLWQLGEPGLRLARRMGHKQ